MDFSSEKSSLVSLIDIPRWQKIQDIFAAFTGIGLRTFDCRYQLVTSPSGESRICSQQLLSPELSKKCLPRALGGEAELDINLGFSCPESFYNCLVALRLETGGDPLGYVLVGPVILISRKDKQYYYNIAAGLGIDQESFWNAVLEIKVLSFYRLRAVIDAISEIGNYLLKTEYEKKHAQERIRCFLKTFLDAALQLSGADIGSVMLFDRQKNLTIRACRGLEQSVVERTKVKLGQGLSGIAAEKGTPIVINRQKHPDNRINAYLCRPQLISSLILPLKIKGDVAGVMNLGVSNPSVTLDFSTAGAISRLAELALNSFYTP